MKTINPLFLLSILFLAACTESTNDKTMSRDDISTVETNSLTHRSNDAYLSQEQAMQRSARISKVDYILTFELTGEEIFTATSTINFDLNDNSTPLTVDLDEAMISQLIVNGEKIAADYNQWFITLAPEQLIKGRNQVKVSFERKHSTDGEGLHRFKDPVDGRVYLYSHFEPAAAHQMFALFDQPDLKANYQMTVTSPTDWHVFSAMKETYSEIIDGKKVWHFDKTLKLSPYNFSLHAGPYQVWEDKSDKYPLRLFARQSVATQVNPADWFNYTNKGLAFFEDYYGVDYPFRKYDQVIVPDFIYGAMENAAAITFAERGFLTNGEMTQSQRQRLAGVILHEMAHQWFGNLVTMKWWNGLWLNESFASFMATLALSEATEFDHAWRSFYAKGKQSAYRADQRVTTHPIEVPIPSSSNAFDNIDAITYSKGASTLKQLRHLLGEEKFRRGIHNYLTTNAYQNAELDDFINSLAEAAGTNLDNWKQEWLYKAGVNTIKVDFQCSDDKISQFNVLQTANEAFPTLREQRVQIALFNVDNKNVQLNKNIAVTYVGATTEVSELVGTECPDLIYPNYQDWGFVKVTLDKRSFATARDNLSHVIDPLLRSMLWQSLWDSVLDGQLPLNDYLDVALKNAPLESDYTILGQALSQISSGFAYLKISYGLEHPYVKEMGNKLESMARENMLLSTDDKNKLRRWFGYYRLFATSEPAMDDLINILNGEITIKNLKINQDTRWAIIVLLNRFAHADAEQLLGDELKADSSDTGLKAALSADVIRPNSKVKAEWLAKLQAIDTDMPFSKLRTVMASMYPSEQVVLDELTANDRIMTLAEMDKTHDHVFMRSYSTLIPATCTDESVARLTKAIDELTKLSSSTRRTLLETHQGDQRCVTIKKKMTINQ